MNTSNKKRKVYICELIVVVCRKFVFLIAILSFGYFFNIIAINIKFAIKVLRYLKM